MQTQVLIAGAGPTGLTLALELARRNITVRIVEQTSEFFAGSRGDGIQPRTLEVFDDLGVLDAVLAAGTPTPVMRAYFGGEFVGERRMSEPTEPTPSIPYPNLWVLGQSRTEGILRDRLAEFGVHVELSTTLVSFDQDDAGVTVTLAHDGAHETVRAGYLVGADGGRSTVRKTLDIPFAGTTDDSIRMLLGDVRADVLDHEYGYWFADAERPMEGIAMSPLPGGRHFQCATPLGVDVEPTLAVLQGFVDRYSGRTDIVLSDLTWATVWRPNIRLAQRFREGRVFVAGDAAHVHPPTGGQGLNTGIQDAYNLGWKLAAAVNGDQSLLDSYESERRTVAARVLGISSELLDKLVDGDEDAMHRGEETRQLDISYRDPADHGPLVAGDRAPDAPLKDANGLPIRLFDLFRGPHSTLLCFGKAAAHSNEPGVHTYTVVRPEDGVPAGAAPEADYAAGETPPRYVVDVEGHAFAAYRAGEGTTVLVRPDGYLGRRS
ncbi:FAD-dependent monooxygenase [Nocardia sp. NPDC051463]|uniref:FAD-dependent monooxygenase n=1 Tax=Nocardia sp. NPDC051463 TaxID=3154845 RepID=UPI00344333C4